MHELLRHHEQTPSNQRRSMQQETVERIRSTTDIIPLADPFQINALVQRMGEPERMDGWLATKELTDSLGSAYDLYWGDLGLLRVCLGNEHATAVFDGNEIDYAPLLSDNPEILTISRLTALLQDGGKVMSVAETGTNFAQSAYNVLIARKIIAGVSDEHLSPRAKQAVIALVGLDVVGGMLQGHDVDNKLARFRAAWPLELEEFREDLMLSSYLSDASAHSAYRLYRNARNGFPEPAVRPEDAQLTFLFEKHRSGAITLTPDRCSILLDRLPNVTRLRYLLTDELGPYAREDEVFDEVVRRKARQGTEDVLCVEVPHEHTRDFYIMERAGRLGVSMNVLTYPYGMHDAAIDRRYWLPGDGRIWERSVWAGNVAPAEHDPSPGQYAHPDPAVANMQRNVLAADRIYASDLGRPLLPADAWRIIHAIENLA